jgi:S1-C subfamily serine protease
VVNISSKRMVRQQVDPFWELFGPRRAIGSRARWAQRDRAVRRRHRLAGHVVEGESGITVALADRREFRARILLADAAPTSPS